MKIGLVLEEAQTAAYLPPVFWIILWNRIWERRFGMSSAPPPAQAMHEFYFGTAWALP